MTGAENIDGCDILGNTKTRISPSKKWCFTLNNPLDEEVWYVCAQIKQYCKIGFYSEEVGESGTPHLQGYIEFKTRRRPIAIFGNRFHWEKAKGTLEDNIEYCHKDTPLSFRHGIPDEAHTITKVNMYPWQLGVLENLTERPQSDRECDWYYGEYKIGKTAMIRYLIKHEGGIILEGSRRHVLSVVGQHQEAKLFVFNLRPGHESDKELFETIETLKDGVFMSNFGTKGTYPVLMNSPTIIVMANHTPDFYYTGIDKKRFRTYNLNNFDLANI